MPNVNADEERARVMRAYENAASFLRAFLSGARGFTSADGLAGVVRLKDACDRMEKDYCEGKTANHVTSLVAEGRELVKAARFRLGVPAL